MDTVAINVASSTNAPSASNLTQTRVYLDGATSVSLGSIIVSDPNSGDTITATLTLSNTATGSLSANNGATYDSSTGIWTMTGTVSQVNTALANVLHKRCRFRRPRRYRLAACRYFARLRYGCGLCLYTPCGRNLDADCQAIADTCRRRRFIRKPRLDRWQHDRHQLAIL